MATGHTYVNQYHIKSRKAKKKRDKENSTSKAIGIPDGSFN